MGVFIASSAAFEGTDQGCSYNQGSRAHTCTCTHVRGHARAHQFNVPNLAHVASPVKKSSCRSNCAPGQRSPCGGPPHASARLGRAWQGRVLEYKGEIITWQEALDRHPHDPEQPNHTFYFHLDDGHVIDGKHLGNSAKWINHSCEPNLEAEQEGDRVFLRALRDIAPGEELFFDYGLVIDSRITPTLKKEYACWCGTPTCRGTMLAIKRRR